MWRGVRTSQSSGDSLYHSEYLLPFTLCKFLYFPQLLWQYGDRHYHAGRWKEAADWFGCGTHPVFASLGPVSSSKCSRKAALAHLKRKDYAHAGSIIRRCPDGEATTQYVTFLIAVHQGSWALGLTALCLTHPPIGLEDEGIVNLKKFCSPLIDPITIDQQ